MTMTDSPKAAQLASTLRRLYLARFGFAVGWALLLALVSPLSSVVLTALLVLYPLVDAASVLIELRASGAGASTRASAKANIVLSVAASLALGIASTVSPAAVLATWGVWAVLSGGAQLVTALRRRRLGGQWPVMISGGLSFVVGFAFLAQGIGGATTVTSIAGYATLGGIFFVISAIRLARSARAA